MQLFLNRHKFQSNLLGEILPDIFHGRSMAYPSQMDIQYNPDRKFPQDNRLKCYRKKQTILIHSFVTDILVYLP